ncbi:MAG: 4-demethylwyosine synthase TYW1 [Nitrososphaerota archaeon]|jgi:tRNA wybutosine-synthesizing protein 1|nr:4-demethylwyosine synthase TYW1 [Nitrososphaerota archaeon]
MECAVLEQTIPEPLKQTLKKQKYHFIGNHSAVKRCKWLYESIVNDRVCYKEKFYGIKSHQCLQMTPSLYYCTQQCLFCWRAQSGDLQVTWDEMKLPPLNQPEDIVKDSITAQEKILSGYKGHPRVNWRKLTEAHQPKNVAISLTGEPTLYPNISELIRTYRQKEFTVFLVTNGTLPKRLSTLNQEPTQLYISLCAPNEQIYKKICRPLIPKAWEYLKESLELLQSFKCRTALRMTLVKNHNMNNIDEYAKLIEKANPTFIEAKAYMHIGFSNLRLGFDDMPQLTEVKTFAGELAKKTGYDIIDESTDSRVVLLSHKDANNKKIK